MRQLNDAHVAAPGLAVVEVAAADDETAFAVHELLAAQCAIAPADRTTREPGGRTRYSHSGRPPAQLPYGGLSLCHPRNPSWWGEEEALPGSQSQVRRR
ncbi:DUF6207 family protein [Streptomyces mirabilis]|uniref:DUF6207 family protein n=2 Tax=Streptomyces TaxID=1883 RepID=UPI0036DF4970